MLPFFAWKIFSISFFISLDFYLQVLFEIFIFYTSTRAVPMRRTEAVNTFSLPNMRAISRV